MTSVLPYVCLGWLLILLGLIGAVVIRGLMSNDTGEWLHLAWILASWAGPILLGATIITWYRKLTNSTKL
jgi:hypothetical protein